MRIGVFVLGMHRSGTSAAARLVNLLGVPTCIEEDLLRTTDDNPRGFWESASLTALNDRILDALGCDWSCPPELEAGWEDAAALAELRREATGLFPEIFPSEQWVWKDPRNCVTFAFWAQVLDVAPVAVLVHRNPLEIAASLDARDRLGELSSLALWERYLRTSLTSLAGLPVLVTDYADLVSDPVAWCERAAHFLSSAGVATSPVRAEDALGFVDAALRHGSFTAEDLRAHPAVSSEQRTLFAALEELQGAHVSFPVVDVAAEAPFTEALLAERRRVSARERALSRQLEELEAYSRDLGERFLALEEYAKSLQEQHATLEEYSRGLQERHAALEEYTRGLQQRLSSR